MDEFIEDMLRTRGYSDALLLAKLNTKGELCLAGDVVIQTLARALYGSPSETSARYHFITDSLLESSVLPHDWRSEKCDPAVALPSTRLPANYFKDVMTSRYCVNDRGIYVTITELPAVHPINAGGLKPTIANYLQTAPLTTDAIVFDIRREKLWGDAGKKALLDKRVEVNQLSHLIYRAFLARIDPKQYVEAHAQSLGFNHASAF